jgi:hypothetical protein
MFIYLIVNHETGKYYVGQHKGNNLQRYLQQKFSHARTGISERSLLFRSMRAHPNPHVWSIHALRSDIQDKTELDETERDFIRFLRSQDPEYGYNICRGGEGFTGPHTEKWKQLSSIAMKEMWQRSEFRDRMVKIANERWSIPEIHKKSIECLKERWANSNIQSNQTKELWKNLDYRAKQVKERRERWTPERRAQHSQRMKNSRLAMEILAQRNRISRQLKEAKTSQSVI